MPTRFLVPVSRLGLGDALLGPTNTTLALANLTTQHQARAWP
jgi:hypothetical protein